jgi:hypothetical protein
MDGLDLRREEAGRAVFCIIGTLATMVKKNRALLVARSLCS